MKRILSMLLILAALLAIPFAAGAEGTIEFTAPTKVFYTVGEEADYSGGRLTYITDRTYKFALSAANCTGLNTHLPGIKTVTVSVMYSAPKAYFNIVVLDDEEPITKIWDVYRGQWFYEAFGMTMKAGLFTGDTLGRLRPNDAITRAEFAALIHRAWKNDPRVMTESGSSAPFTDVPSGEWYYQAVEACRKAGIIRGFEDGSFRPNQKISRQDAVLMLMRIRHTEQELAAVNIPQAIKQSGINPKDFALVADYAAGAMALALGDLIRGDSANKINPQKTITRAETATIYQRLFFEGYKWTPPALPEPKPEPKPDPSKMPLIFLSPSSQFENRYTGVNTNEGTQMNLLAEVIKKKLEAAGYRVYLPSSDTTYQERAELSNKVGADLHIPLHSNAGGGSGTRIFYNGKLQGSKELSQEIFKKLGVLTNSNDPKVQYLIDDSTASTPFHEIRVPKAEMAYIEVEFHDNATKAKWIVNNREAIAEAITQGTINYCKKYLLK